MTIKSQIQALKDLAALDAVLSGVGQELDTEREALLAKKGQLSELNERVERAGTHIAEMERTRSDLMTEVRQMGVQVTRSREKLARCRTEREANAAQREVEELRKLYRDREVDIERLNGLIESAQAETSETQGQRDTLQAELGSSEGQVQGRLDVLEAESKEKLDKRKGLIAKVDPAIFRRYELIRKRRGQAISPAIDGCCSVCHMSLPPMLVQQVMQAKEMLQCPSCNRILYFDPEAGAEQSESSTASTEG